MSDEKKGLLEAIKLGREVKEAVPAGSEYTRSKTAAQFYKGVLKDIENREREARDRLEELKKQPRSFVIDDSGVFIPYGEDLEGTMKEITLLKDLMQASWDMLAARKGKDTVKDLMQWEENHSNKVGIEEVRRRLLENDMLTAAALQERGR